MTTSRRYTLITPRADRTGPSNVAVDIGRAAAAAGWHVSLLYLSGHPTRDDLDAFAEVRPLRFSDVWRLRGVIHTHGLRPDLVGWIFTWNPRCTVMSTLHGHFPGHLSFDYSPWKVRLAWGLWSAALARFDHRVCISKTMVRHYRHQFPNMTFDLAYNFRADRPSGESPPKPEIDAWFNTQRQQKRVVLVYVGSLTARKNVRPLVQAVLRSPELTLLICGQGDEQAAVAAELQAQDPSRRILLAGHLTDPDVFVAKSDVLVLASHAEGLPLVVLEAASLGVPCLLSNLAVHRELAAMGFGTTFDRHGFSDFAQKAQLLARDRTVATDASRLAVWSQRFSSRQGFAQYEQLLTRAK